MSDYQLTQYDFIIRIIDGANIPIDSSNRDYMNYQSWLNDGNTPLPYVPAKIIPNTILTPTEFLARFSQTEQKNIISAAQSNSQMLLWVIKMASSTSIDVGEISTKSIVEQLESYGLIASGRANQILDLSLTSP